KMDRFSWSNGLLEINETLVIQQRGVRLYDGDDKAKLDVGVALLSTHRLIWRDIKNHECCIAMPLSQIIFFEEQAAGIGKSAKIVIHLHPTPANKEPGPYQHSKFSFIKLSFKEHGQIEFYRRLTEEMTQKRWENIPASQPIPTGTSSEAGRTRAVGIVGIERKIEEKRKETDKNISEAFEDLSKLMVKAKEMVELSKSIANKIKDKQGDITEDETIRFKSYLLSMGIANPVTRETHGSGTHYHFQLAKQLGDILQAPLEERGGMMALTEVYCLVNRARGMELLSPEDLVNACKMFESLKAPVEVSLSFVCLLIYLALRVFDSGVMVVQLQSHSEEEMIASALDNVSEKGSLTAEEFAKLLGLSVLLSKERGQWGGWWWLKKTVMRCRRKQRHRHRNATGCLTAALPAGAHGMCNASVFVDYSVKSNSSTIRSASLSLVNTETNTTLMIRNLPNNQSSSRVEFNCSCFLYAGTFRFLLRQTSTSVVSHANGTGGGSSRESTDWWWSSELQVGISTNEHFQACSSGVDSALFLEVSYMEYNQIGRNSIDKVRDRSRHPIKPLRSQSIELPCAFPFTERDFVRVALRSPHATQEVKSSGPLYLSRIFSYKLLVDNGNAYKSGCEGTMTVKLITPPCAHINGKVLLYKDAGVGQGVAVSSGMGAGGTALMGFGPEEPSSPPLAFNWLTQGENETEFNCSVFYPGRNKYCFRFVFNFSRSPSPAQTCLVVHRSAESWGPWQPWSVCSVSCGEGVRERVRACLLPSGVGGVKCTGMVKEQSLCSLEDCRALPAPSPSLPPVPVGVAPLGGNVVVVAGISLCLAVILATIVVTVWRKFCQRPQCSSVHTGSMHSPGGRKLSDEASICGHSLQRPSLSDGHGPLGGVCVSVAHKDAPVLSSQPLSQTLVIPLPQDPERLSPTGQKLLPPIFGYRLAQQQLKEMKKKGLKEATQLYHVSSSPVHDTLLETSASPTSTPVPTPLPLGLQDDANHSLFRIAAPFSEPPSQTPRVTSDRLSPRGEMVLGPLVSTRASGGSSKWRDRTADWVEMVERSGLAGLRGGGGGDTGMENSYHKNPNFRRTSSFNDTRPQPLSSTPTRQFRERSMTQVGSRTLPEGSSWTKGGWERQPFRSYPIPEHRASEWAKSRPQRDDQRMPWTQTAVPSHSSELKHTGTNTNSISALAKADHSGTGERRRSGEPGGGEGISGIGGPAAGSTSLIMDRAERAEQNWNRRGPSPMQRNILARKLKEAQSSAGAKGRQCSSTFSVSSSEQRKGRGRSLPMSVDYSSSGGSPYRLSEAEQRMLDLDLSSA
ncbi:hypothetical protein L3Q82_022278, partial [Scortum barcoo]